MDHPSSITRKHAWVTGSNGTIGATLTRRLLQHGYQVTGFGRGQTPDDILHHPLFTATPAETLTEKTFSTALAANPDIDLVFHLASSGSVGKAAADPVQAKQDITGTSSALLKALAGHPRRPRIIHASSAAIYGNQGNMDTNATLPETLPYAPLSLYGELKQAAEILMEEARLAGADIVNVRLFSVYGPGLRKQLLWEAAKKLQKTTGPVTFFGSGREVRDFLYIDDCCHLLHWLGEQAEVPSVINGGSGQGVTVYDVLRVFIEAWNFPGDIRFNGQCRQDDPDRLVADSTILNNLGWQPSTSLVDGMKHLVQWQRQALAQEDRL